MEAFGTALDIAGKIKSKELSPVEVVKRALVAMDRHNDSLNAITWRCDEEALAQAKSAEAMVNSSRDLPPFFGVPTLVKDLTEARDQPHTLGSRCFKERRGNVDAAVVDSMRKAGFIFVGRSNSPEFGTLPVTENDLYGATRNPWNLERTPGGSSGGAAAAVASGMVPIAHASDGGGSIRIPASCCGLVGLKPNRARIPKGPLISEAMHGFSTDGCVSRTIADTAAFLDAITRFDRNAWYNVPKEEDFLGRINVPPPKLKIAFTSKPPVEVKVDKDCLDAVENTAKALEDLGHHVFEAQPDWEAEAVLTDFIAVWKTISAYVGMTEGQRCEPINQSLREAGLKQNSLDYVQAIMRLQAYSRKVIAHFGQDYDLLLTPVLAMEPPPIGWIFEARDQSIESIIWRCSEMVPFTSWCNITGQPAISLPTAQGKSGLPVGVQLAGPAYSEALLLRVGRQLEEVYRWDKLVPGS
jgi:amidase